MTIFAEGMQLDLQAFRLSKDSLNRGAPQGRLFVKEVSHGRVHVHREAH